MGKVTHATLKKTVTAANTAEALSSTSLLVSGAVIQAMSTNTGHIYIGGPTDVDDHAAASGTAGIMLGVPDTDKTPPSYTLADFNRRGDDVSIDLADIYIDCSVSGEGVIVHYFQI